MSENNIHNAEHDPNSQEIRTDRILSKPHFEIDYELYAGYLENSDIPEDQKRELMQTVWNLMFEFVSLGFEIHPLQQLEQTCGQKFRIGSEAKPAPRKSGKMAQSSGK